MQMDGHTTQIWTLLHSIQKTQRLANTRHMDTHTQNLNNQRIHNRQAQHREYQWIAQQSRLKKGTLLGYDGHKHRLGSE